MFLWRNPSYEPANTGAVRAFLQSVFDTYVWQLSGKYERGLWLVWPAVTPLCWKKNDAVEGAEIRTGQTSLISLIPPNTVSRFVLLKSKKDKALQKKKKSNGTPFNTVRKSCARRLNKQWLLFLRTDQEGEVKMWLLDEQSSNAVRTFSRARLWTSHARRPTRCKPCQLTARLSTLPPANLTVRIKLRSRFYF